MAATRAPPSGLDAVRGAIETMTAGEDILATFVASDDTGDANYSCNGAHHLAIKVALSAANSLATEDDSARARRLGGAVPRIVERMVAMTDADLRCTAAEKAAAEAKAKVPAVGLVPRYLKGEDFASDCMGTITG